MVQLTQNSVVTSYRTGRRLCMASTTRAFSPLSTNTIQAVFSGVKAVWRAMSGLRGSMEDFARRSGLDETVCYTVRSSLTCILKNAVHEAQLFVAARLTMTP